ncbi:MAG: hypothetical protein ACLFQV_10935 [Vulcanimicrobiota bacterium]
MELMIVIAIISICQYNYSQHKKSSGACSAYCLHGKFEKHGHSWQHVFS